MKIYVVRKTENVTSRINSSSAFGEAVFEDLGNERPKIVTVDQDEARAVYDSIELSDAKLDSRGRYVIEAKDLVAFEIDDDEAREMLDDGYSLLHVAYEGKDLGGDFAVSLVYPDQFAQNDDLKRYFQLSEDVTDDAMAELCSRVGLSDEWSDASYSPNPLDSFRRVFREALRRFGVD